MLQPVVVLTPADHNEIFSTVRSCALFLFLDTVIDLTGAADDTKAGEPDFWHEEVFKAFYDAAIKTCGGIILLL